MAGLMELPIIIPLSHDSIAVGEDGPTHQPVEQLVMLRSIPNVQVLRPADAVETAASWKIAMESSKNPTAIILTRQNVATMEQTSCDGVSKGAYIVGKEVNKLDAIIIASGSEVSLAIEMASDFGWHKYVGLDGKTMSVNTFGASAPADVVIENYGFTVNNVVKNIKEIL